MRHARNLILILTVMCVHRVSMEAPRKAVQKVLDLLSWKLQVTRPTGKTESDDVRACVVNSWFAGRAEFTLMDDSDVNRDKTPAVKVTYLKCCLSSNKASNPHMQYQRTTDACPGLSLQPRLEQVNAAIESSVASLRHIVDEMGIFTSTFDQCTNAVEDLSSKLPRSSTSQNSTGFYWPENSISRDRGRPIASEIAGGKLEMARTSMRSH
ncbi:hypothetical protein FOL47_007659 [Perkinsus chesapeaki]|uniref:Uncharacterized protein n=1 Tax=Perkinsus chesapeaki TaxID=330153 RepID=A0A7J6MX90_PERCH|nr:hypothetical protein FOL47_007659 [Perkinsus chesapeaki]